MKWLTNLYDPRKSDAKRYITARFHETQDEAWKRQQQWLQDKIIGEPKAGHYLVEALKKMNMVGVYKTED